MKPSKAFSFLPLIGLLISAIPALAQDPFEEGLLPDIQDHQEHRPKQLRIYTENYEITAVEFAKLMTTPHNSSNQDNLRDSLLEKVTQAKAKLIDNHSIICRSGEQAVLESVQEYIYATEDEPPQGLPSIKGQSDENQADFQPMTMVPPTPTAFETRNLGHTLVVEPVLGDDEKTIDLRLSPESSQHVGDHIISDWALPFVKMTVAYPTFYSKRINTSVTLSDGEFLLAGTYSPEKAGKTDHSRKILYFVRVEVLTVGGE